MKNETLEALKAKCKDTRPEDWVQTWGTLRDFFEGRGGEHVMGRLQVMQLGIRSGEDQHPIVSGALTELVTALAVAYRSPATRRLVNRNGQPLSDEGVATKQMIDAYRRSNFDAVAKTIDQRRSLYGQCYVRMNATSMEPRIFFHVFSPDKVYRDPHPALPWDVSQDRAVALKTASGFEVWAQASSGWTMTLTDADGDELEDEFQPFGPSRQAPFPPPVVACYDQHPEGAYVRPRSDRVSHLLNLSAICNEILEQVRVSSHSEVEYRQPADIEDTKDAKDLKTMKRGPGVRNIMPPGVEGHVLQVSPAIADALTALDKFQRDWKASEGLPVDDIRRSQSVTAVGLRQAAKPLEERRELLRAYVADAERRIFRAFRSVWNAWAPVWEVPRMREDVELEVDLAPLDHAVDPKEQTETLARQMALHMASRVTAGMQLWQVDRTDAERKLEEIDKDFERFPVAKPEPEVAEANAEIPGPNQADPSGDSVNAGASVVSDLMAAS
ncbi:MAG: hypothetical protein AAF851_05715 [Myxococcota bacterium]